MRLYFNFWRIFIPVALKEVVVKTVYREFPGGPVRRTLRFHCRGPGSVPGRGNNIPQAAQHAARPKTNKKQFTVLIL